MGSRQVRISDDLAEWLSGQGGSLSAAAERVLVWAREATEGAEDEPPSADRPPAGERPIRGGVVRTSSRKSRSVSFAPLIRRF